MGENIDMFVGLGWENEIRSLEDLHIPFNSSPEFEFRAGNWGSDDYELIPFSQYTEAWRWRVHEEQKQHEEIDKKHKNVPEKDVDLDEDNSKETEEEVKVEGESSKNESLAAASSSAEWSNESVIKSSPPFD